MSKAIKLQKENYIDSSSIVHNRKRLSDVLKGSYCRNSDTLSISGKFLTNPDTQGTFPAETNKYGQLTSITNDGILGEGFQMRTQYLVVTWSNRLFMRTKTNESDWTNWRAV